MDLIYITFFISVAILIAGILSIKIAAKNENYKKLFSRIYVKKFLEITEHELEALFKKHKLWFLVEREIMSKSHHYTNLVYKKLKENIKKKGFRVVNDNFSINIWQVCRIVYEDNRWMFSEGIMDLKNEILSIKGKKGLIEIRTPYGAYKMYIEHYTKFNVRFIRYKLKSKDASMPRDGSIILSHLYDELLTIFIWELDLRTIPISLYSKSLDPSSICYPDE